MVFYESCFWLFGNPLIGHLDEYISRSVLIKFKLNLLLPVEIS